MADIVPFRRQKRLKSLDELDGPIWKLETSPPKTISAVWLAAGGLLAGAGLGLVLVTLI